MKNFQLPRIDNDEVLKNYLEKFCRIKKGEVWHDPEGKHKVGCTDATDRNAVKKVMHGKKAQLAVHDPPYNMVAFDVKDANDFITWCKKWIDITEEVLDKNSALYIWLGANQKKHFEPFAEFILMMRDTGFVSKSFITMRNQRGYGTQKNWMAVRQELLYYAKGNPVFNIEAVHTDIPKAVKGYYKKVGGKLTENIERSKSDKIRAGNVWIDIQQVFHLREENVNGCYVQKPVKAVERIIRTSSNKNDLVIDFFSHSGTTLLAAEMLKRKSVVLDIEPIYCEITIRRLERYRKTGKLGWQNSNPFEKEILKSKKIQKYLYDKYKLKINS